MRPRWVIVVAVLLLAWIYSHGIVSNPLKWEEPRRCLVAMEMIHSGDWVSPTVLGQPYRKKPPLQNWLIAIASGNDASRVGPLTVRLVSLAALAGICFFLWRLGLSGTQPAANPLPALVFLTLGIVVQSGRAGEVDILFAFFVCGALACYEMGRRRGARVLQWLVPQLFVAGGVLTKVLAPAFVYPPMLYCAWRRRREQRFSPVALAIGAALAVWIVRSWMVPYGEAHPDGGLRQRWVQEVLTRTVQQGGTVWLRHLATYPFQLLGWLLPWSLLLFALGRDVRRELAAALRRDPLLALSAATVVWGGLMYLFVPEQKGRYLIPVLPAFSILAAHLAARILPEVRGPAGRRGLANRLLVPLLSLGLAYGVVFAGFVESREARRGRLEVRAAQRIADRIGDPRPVVCHMAVNLEFAYALSRRLGRPLRREAAGSAASYWIAPSGIDASGDASVVEQAPPYALWRVGDAEAWSLLGEPLFPPPLPADVRQAREAELESARRARAAAPDDTDAAIWLGRRTAYLGRYRDAIAVYDQAIERDPEDPRLYRHRGHRRISLRRFDEAIADLQRAADRIEGTADRVEPDGLPNARNTPTSTLHSNVWYHLGLAQYLEGDLESAVRSYRRGMAFANNPDMTVAMTYWLHMALRRSGRAAEAAAVIAPIHAGMDIIENHAYHRLLLMFKGELSPETLLEQSRADDDLDPEAVGYGVGNWYLMQGKRDRAGLVWLDVVARKRWPAFGHIAAEADLARIWARAL